MGKPNVFVTQVNHFSKKRKITIKGFYSGRMRKNVKHVFMGETEIQS